MKEVGKYNLFKAISTVLGVGTPIVTLALCSDFFIQSPSASISAGGIFALLFAALFLKDKIAEKFKVTSVFVVSSVLFVIILLVENIIMPIKWVCLATMIASGIDELTFKKFYQRIECELPEKTQTYKIFGFITCKTETLLGKSKGEQDEQ